MPISQEYNRNQEPDEKLLDDSRLSGDLEILGVLYKRYMHLVYGVCLKYLKDREKSQDAVMEIFESLIDKLKKHDINNFKSWLHVTSKNHCLMELRKNSPELPLDDYSYQLMESDGSEHPDNETELESDLVRLEACIKKLNGEQHTCVTLFFLKKKSYTEIAESTGYPLKKVKSFIQNGKRNLKICMEADGTEENGY